MSHMILVKTSNDSKSIEHIDIHNADCWCLVPDPHQSRNLFTKTVSLSVCQSETTHSLLLVISAFSSSISLYAILFFGLRLPRLKN